MRTAFLVIGAVILIGGVSALLDPGAMTLFPSGAKLRRPVEISAEQKRVAGIASIGFGAVILLGAFIAKKTSETEKERGNV
jgi:hypothetical protein